MQRRKSTRKKRVIRTRRKMSSTSSKSSVGKTLVDAGAGLANSFFPGAGSLVKGLGKLIGFGAYTREGAENYLASRVPSMHSTIDQGIRIAHHEYLGEMSSSVVFSITSYPINPGFGGTFPWLSSIAGAFQKWEDHGIVFYFKSTSALALNSTNTALGSVIGAVTYNPYQMAPGDKVTMLALSGVSTGKPAEDNLFPVECKMSQSLFGTKLVRTGAVTDDLAKYDAGNFHLATVGSQAIAIIGELHVVYDITLKEPKLSPSGWSAHFSTDSYDNNLVIPYADTAKTCDAFGIDLSNPTATTTMFVLPKFMGSSGSIFKWSFYWEGAVGAGVVYPAVALTNLAYFPITGGGPWAAGWSQVPTGAINPTKVMLVMFLKITDPKLPATITLTGGGGCTLPATPTRVNTFVVELDSTFI